ncbi:16S rRNA (cytosine(967)-C(5))-methyltransferase RsmB [Amphritea sp. 1_MG-2023]|uniref:16S rRNA (cytosine(967)-C(5))-methyltransferase RsmB n=1 Tax=Amphritea sp. 1_MG-2023 TaxID=3062670 RepID=UPI0026E48137|nr:16S rRNA (cytosine(967)-C(5))-methyltransferase RsmB [Amphritea sp. 1_MG-2023]MDO6562354.1 16S rRNA (cytosine(967)-C(5))-methyltransferase RsmB [Amphritea sp. 1_MG-2023]
MNIRAIAARALGPVIGRKESLNTALPRALQHCHENDRALLQQLCYGTMRSLPKLACLADKLLKKPFKPQDQDLYALVLLGFYQLLEMRVPAHAAISETVEAAAQLNKGWAKGLLNALLRTLQREQDTLFEQLSEQPEFRYNHPQWMIAKLQHNWPDQWQEVVTQNNQQPPMTLRINKRKTNREAYLQQLHDADIAASATPYSNVGIQLASPVDVSILPGFEYGFVSVQDEAAQLSSTLLDLQPGQRVLDACAAPGGKLCHILEHEPDLAHVTAIELEESRASRIQENLLRLNLDADVIIDDAASHTWWDGAQYDRILVDAPCSAAGVIRRNPDIKHLRQSEDIKTLTEIQLSILENCWKLLKPSGRLLYATCSVFPQENERVVERFTKAHADACHLPIVAEWGIERPFGRQLFPQPQGHDGFYYAVLLKDQS